MASDSVSTRNVWPYYDKKNVQMAAEKKKDDNNTLGKDDFLRILVTQLRNQDPMQPLQDRDFIAQMAQFTSVEQLMNMSNEMTMLRQNLGMASSMIGKDIAWYDYTETGELVPFSGKVESILIKDNVQYAVVDDSQIPLDKIVSIAEGGETSDASDG